MTEPVVRRRVRGADIVEDEISTIMRRGIRGAPYVTPPPPIVSSPVRRSNAGAPEREILTPFSFSRGGGVATTTDPDVQVRQQVEALLHTNPGERVMRPTYGVSLLQYLFTTPTPADLAAMQGEISTGFDTWIPTARLVALQGLAGPTQGVAIDTVIITLSYARRFDANPTATSIEIPVVTQ